MAGFIRRFTSVPSIEVIRQIEGPVVIDLAPPAPATGAGSGTVLVVGEFEDGFFATEPESKGAVEVFGSEDLRQKFGGFGFTYNGVPSSNPAARRHLSEFWNGNGFIKLFKFRSQRLMVARVDTSVGEVSFDPMAGIVGSAGPYQLAVGQTLEFTTNLGTAATAALTAAVATKLGNLQAFASLVSGDTFGVRIDGGPQINVSFSASDTSQAAVVARINATLGFASAIAAATEVNIRGILPGTAGTVELIEVTPGVLTKLGHAAGSVSGTGSVANINAVGTAELVALINGTAGLSAIDVLADITPEGALRVGNSTSSVASTIAVTAGEMATAVGLTNTATVKATDHPGGTIAAGTRVRNAGGDEWVTMQTLDIDPGVLGPYTVKVRPALDDGTAAGTGAGTITTVVDPSGIGNLLVSNASALTAALSEVQIDNAYIAAMAATLAESGPAREANYLLSARRSDAIVREGKANVLKATECGLFARKFITGDPLGTTVSQILANVALYRSDRVFYVGKGLKIRIPAIAERGEAGGLGFTKDGVITVRPDGPLTTICATLNPEENPGQQTGLIDDFFEVDSSGETLDIEAYKAFRRNGVAVPRVDRVSGVVFQSGVTSSLVSGRETMARRKMADQIQDTGAELLLPYSKKLNRRTRRDKVRGIWEGYLASLLSESSPDSARIEGFVVDDSINAGNTPQVLAQGVYFIQTTVRTLSSLDNIVLQTEIGENAVTTREL